MANSLAVKFDGYLEKWALNLTEIRNRPPDYTILSWNNGSFSYPNGKPANFSDSKINKQDVLCRVDPEKVAWASIEVPAEATQHLDGIVANKLTQLSPWDIKSVKYGYDLAGTPSKAGSSNSQLIAIAMVNGEDFAFKGDGKSTGSSRPRSVNYEVVSSAGGRITLRGMGEGRATKNMSAVVQTKSFLISLGLVAVLGWAAWYAVGYWENNANQELDTRQQNARTELRKIQALEDANSDSDNVIVKLKNEQPSVQVLLEAIARLLPNSTHAESIQLENGVIRVSGLTDDAAFVLREIANSGVFNEARFVSPIVREDNGSRLRFEIEAKVGLDDEAMRRLQQLLDGQLVN